MRCFRAGCKTEKSEKYEKIEGSDKKKFIGSAKIICGQCENHIQTTLKKETLISDYFKPKKNILKEFNYVTNSSGNKGKITKYLINR
jgi:hypothetical protein